MDDLQRHQAQQMIEQMGQHYDYDVSYMRYLLEHSDYGFMALSQITDIHSNITAVPTDAAFTARLIGLKQEDCGPCLQLTICMAQEANMAADQITAVLSNDVESMSAEVVTAYQFAAAVLEHTTAADKYRQAVVEHWGEKGLAELTFALHVVRLYPQIKRALGFDSPCEVLQVGELSKARN